MGKMKWFAGGNDRSQEAITIIEALLTDLETDPKTKPLQAVLISYKDELEKQESSIPYILSRMNIAVSNTNVKNGITLSESQSSKLSKLSALSNIYYGY